MPSDSFLGKQVRKQAFEFTCTSVLGDWAVVGTTS